MATRFYKFLECLKYAQHNKNSDTHRYTTVTVYSLIKLEIGTYRCSWFLNFHKFTPNEGMNEREKEREIGRENRGEG